MTPEIGKRTVAMTANAVAQTPYVQLLLEFAPRMIRSQSQYQRVLRQIARLMRKQKLSRPEDDLLELLASLVGQYEQTCFPAPEVTPGQVLEHLIEVRGVNSADVASATGISVQTINNAIDGSQELRKSHRAVLAKFFHVSADLFLPAE
jgi:HTH-type transcriptional regulator/antitoxin HigA